MFYRRKVILALLQAFGEEVPKTDFQKYLFLFTQQQREPTFDFLPYRYGCYSFQAEADRRTMVQQGLLRNGDNWSKGDSKDYVASLTPDDRRALIDVKRQYGSLRGRDLLASVYREYPYFAVNSEVAHEVLTERELETVKAARPTATGTCLFTIGYEGQSLESYVNRLLEHDVRLLCDVRMNPLSRKFGFSKGQLQATVEKMGIGYVHIPELGIASGKRKALSSPDDYTRLFADYERETLPERIEQLEYIRTLVDQYERVALTCFEQCHEHCHRSRVASALTKLQGWKNEVVHI